MRVSKIDWLVAAAGPLAIGALVGAQGGAALIAERAMTLPILFFGVSVVMLPALYIGTSFIGAAPPAGAVGAAFVRGFRACGTILLGLAAPVAFLLATTQSDSLALSLGALVAGLGAIAGLRVIFADLFAENPEPILLRGVFGAWSAVSLAIGAQMYVQFMAL